MCWCDVVLCCTFMFSTHSASQEWGFGQGLWRRDGMESWMRRQGVWVLESAVTTPNFPFSFLFCFASDSISFACTCHCSSSWWHFNVLRQLFKKNDDSISQMVHWCHKQEGTMTLSAGICRHLSFLEGLQQSDKLFCGISLILLFLCMQQSHIQSDMDKCLFCLQDEEMQASNWLTGCFTLPSVITFDIWFNNFTSSSSLEFRILSIFQTFRSCHSSTVKISALFQITLQLMKKTFHFCCITAVQLSNTFRGAIAIFCRDRQSSQCGSKCSSITDVWLTRQCLSRECSAIHSNHQNSSSL